MKPKTLKKRLNGFFSKLTLGAGALLMITSYLIYKYVSTGFWTNVVSDIFGTGLAVFIAGLIWVIFRRRI